MNVGARSIKKILMTADTLGGVWSYALDLCEGLNRRGIQVCLATMGAPLSANQQLEAARIPNLDIRESSYKLEWMDQPWEDVDRAGHWLLELEKEIQPDVIHLNGYALASLNWSSAVIIVAHSCVLSWWKALRDMPLAEEWLEYKRRVQLGFKEADAVVSISHAYADELTSLYGEVENLSVIYNGRSSVGFQASVKKQQIFAMGRIWDEAKNLASLGRLENPHHIPILIAGNNRHPDHAEPLDIPNVQLLGTLSQAEVKRYLAESYIYVLPAKYEPFGLSVLEAALSGCLLLLSDIPVFKELWTDTALYFNPDEPKELDELISKVIQHPEEYAALVHRAQARARFFSVDSMVDNYLELYQSLVQTEHSSLSIKE
jgi:glycogen(starch) synthase